MPALFESLKKQTWQDFEIIVVDNASSDDPANVILSEAKDLLDHESRIDSSATPQNDKKIRVRFIQNPTNVGFAAGHNQIFALSQSSYHLVLNQDIYLEPDCLEKLIGFMDGHADAAMVGPKLLKWNFGDLNKGNEVDSLGLLVLRSRRVIDKKKISERGSHSTIAQGKLSTTTRNDNVSEVFGVSGACALFRRAAVETVGGLFDENFFTYKEDVDLAYRINSAGGKYYVFPEAVAHHARTGADSGQANDYAQARNKTNQPDLVKYYSYRNHLITLFKNEYWQNFIIDLPWILWYELKKFGYFLLFDRAVLAGLGDIWQARQEIKKQRTGIKKLRKLNWKEMRSRMSF